MGPPCSRPAAVQGQGDTVALVWLQKRDGVTAGAASLRQLDPVPLEERGFLLLGDVRAELVFMGRFGAGGGGGWGGTEGAKCSPWEPQGICCVREVLAEV